MPPVSRTATTASSLHAVREETDSDEGRSPLVTQRHPSQPALHPTLSALSRLTRTPSASAKGQGGREEKEEPRREAQSRRKGSSKDGKLREWARAKAERKESKVLITQGDDSDSDYDTDLEGEGKESQANQALCTA